MSFLGGIGNAIDSGINVGSFGAIGKGPLNGFLGSGIGTGSIMGLLPGSQGNFNAPPMDPGSEAQVGGFFNKTPKTADQNQQNIMQGTEAAQPIANQSGNQQISQNELGGGGMPGMGQAISNKAAKNFATSQGRLGQQAQMSGVEMANTQSNIVATNAISLQNAATGVQSQINNYNLQANAATYQTVSSLMSGAGSLAGSYAGQQNQQALLTAMNQNPNTIGEQPNASMPSYEAPITSQVTEGEGL